MFRKRTSSMVKWNNSVSEFARG